MKKDEIHNFSDKELIDSFIKYYISYKRDFALGESHFDTSERYSPLQLGSQKHTIMGSFHSAKGIYESRQYSKLFDELVKRFGKKEVLLLEEKINKELGLN